MTGVAAVPVWRSPAPWILLAAFVLVWFASIGIHPPMDPDEGRYGEIPREMYVTGDWVTPRLNELKYFEKPPLQYWATAAFYHLAGVSIASSRLWAVTTGCLGVLLMAALALRLWDRRTALLAAAVQAGALLYALIGHINLLDMGFAFCLQLALAGMLLLLDVSGPRRQRAGTWLLAVGVALAFLSKGLAGVLIPGAVGFIYLLVSGDWKLLLRARPWLVVLVLAVAAGPWIYAVSRRNPEFMHFFFVHEHFDRFLTRVHARYQPPTYFLPVLAVGFMPWTPLLPTMAADAWRAWRAGERVTQLLVIWVGFVFLFFSFSQSKLIPYILPIVPALALLAGRALHAREGRAVVTLATAAGGWLLLAAGSTVALNWPEGGEILRGRAGEAAAWIVAALWLVGVLTAASAIVARYGRPQVAVCSAAFATMVFAAALLWAAQWIPNRLDQNLLIHEAHDHLTDRTRLFCVDLYLQAAPFEFRRPCQLVRYRGELDFGLSQEPWKWTADLPQFVRDWSAQQDAIAFMPPATYAALKQMDLPMAQVHKRPSLIVITR
ncbi:MAG: glycosyltransferase family 39 protein [Steroidobacteraceae bacterium]